MSPRKSQQDNVAADTTSAARGDEQRLVSMAAVVARTTYSRPSIYRLIAEGRFPVPLKLGRTKIAFIEDEIAAWMDSRPRALSATDKLPIDG